MAGKPNTQPELLAPAGNFICAYYAFEAGADAVYAGLEKFSARKRANNLVFTELLKLKELAAKKNRRVYIAINTVIKEEEFDELARILFSLETIEIDEVIVQDFGLLFFLNRYFPRLAVHASTQAAIHDEAGIREMQKRNVKRIVLPREFPLDRIKNLKDKFPDMEFEVFIHGAICYSFSGLCLASGILFNRSGNRGECSQVCRSMFSFAGKESYYLACKDLFTGEHVRDLADAGIDSLKIEGRLKPPEYVYHVVKYYRYLLDNSDALNTPEYKILYDNAQIVFSRENTPGRLSAGLEENIIIDRYTRHSGKPIGRVVSNSNHDFTFATDTELRAFDVISVYPDKSDTAPYKIPVRTFMVDGHQTDTADVFAPAGSLVTIESEIIPEPDQDVYKLYAKGLELPGIRHYCFDEYKKHVPCTLILRQEENASITFVFELFGKKHMLSWPVTIRTPENPESVSVCLQKALDRNTGKIFYLDMTRLINRLPLPDNLIAIPEKLLARIIGFVYGHIDTEQIKYLKTRIDSLKPQENERSRISGISLELMEEISEFILKRENLNPKESMSTFYSGRNTDIDSLALSGDAVFVPLKPLVIDDSSMYADAVFRVIESAGKRRVFLGLNNLSHLSLIDACRRYENVFFFVDYFFYPANSYTIAALCACSDRIIFGYSWIEGDEKNRILVREKTGFPLIRISRGFTPALFIRAGDFFRESIEEKGMKSGYSKNSRLSLGTVEFRIVVEQGISYFFCS